VIGVVGRWVPGADRAWSHRPIEQTVVTIRPPGTLAVALGNDRSGPEPDVRACAAAYRHVAQAQFATHTDGASAGRPVVRSDPPPVYGRVEAGRLDPARGVWISLRRDWPANEQCDGNPDAMAASGR
jgi:hypothetical protein